MVIVDEPRDGSESELLYVKAAKLVSDSLGAALFNRAFEECFFARRGDVAPRGRHHQVALFILLEMTP